MKAILVTGLFDIAARLPLRVLHAAGALLGRLMYALDRTYASRLRDNLAYVYRGKPEAEFERVRAANVREMGKSITELAWVWRRPVAEIMRKIQSVEGRVHLDAALSRGKGVIILTPHLGCFELVGQYLAQAAAMTSMYRVPKMQWLDGIVRTSRERGGMKLARADVSGVRALLKALKRNEMIGVLPDQVPGNGEGEWAEYFGRPAYTITLVGRLAEATGASVVLAYGERLPAGRGYVVHLSPLELDYARSVARQVNAAQERLILQCPEQYLWSYNRYKVPAGAPPPQLTAEGKA